MADETTSFVKKIVGERVYLAPITASNEGFKDAGRLRERAFVAGKYYDVLEMDVLASEFKGNFIKNRNL